MSGRRRDRWTWTRILVWFQVSTSVTSSSWERTDPVSSSPRWQRAIMRAHYCLSLWRGVRSEMKCGSWAEVLARPAATLTLALCLCFLHVIALKSQLFHGRFGVFRSSEGSISYQTLYFDQKVSLKAPTGFLTAILLQSMIWSLLLFRFIFNVAG